MSKYIVDNTALKDIAANGEGFSRNICFTKKDYEEYFTDLPFETFVSANNNGALNKSGWGTPIVSTENNKYPFQIVAQDGSTHTQPIPFAYKSSCPRIKRSGSSYKNWGTKFFEANSTSRRYVKLTYENNVVQYSESPNGRQWTSQTNLDSTMTSSIVFIDLVAGGGAGGSAYGLYQALGNNFYKGGGGGGSGAYLGLALDLELTGPVIIKIGTGGTPNSTNTAGTEKGPGGDGDSTTIKIGTQTYVCNGGKGGGSAGKSEKENTLRGLGGAGGTVEIPETALQGVLGYLNVDGKNGGNGNNDEKADAQKGSRYFSTSYFPGFDIVDNRNVLGTIGGMTNPYAHVDHNETNNSSAGGGGADSVFGTWSSYWEGDTEIFIGAHGCGSRGEATCRGPSNSTLFRPATSGGPGCCIIHYSY